MRTRRLVDRPRDPSSLLYDDGPLPADYRLREAITRLRMGGLPWPCALAWVCAREPKFVEEFDAACRRQNLSLDSASALLIERLMRRFRTSQSTAKRAVALADDQISDLLMFDTILKSHGKRANGLAEEPIEPGAWSFFEKTGATAYDAFFDWDQEALLFVEARIDAGALLRRWGERPLARLVAIDKKSWSLPETLYWYAKRTHLGYEGENALTFDEMRSAQESLGHSLRTGALHCRASLRADVPGASISTLEVADRDTKFWQTFSLTEIAVAEFDSESVRQVMPADVDADLSGCTSHKEAEKVLMTKHHMPLREARSHLKRVGFPKGTPGPKPRSR